MTTRSKTGLRRTSVLIVVAALLSVIGPANLGCAPDQCSDGESRCDGDVVLDDCFVGDNLSGDRTFHAHYHCKVGTRCIGTTKSGTSHAVCSATSEPDPRCEGASDTRCVDSNVLLRCDVGFSDGGSPCDVVCLHPQQGSAFCAVSKDTNPSCRLDMTQHPTFCEADRVARCNELGYVLNVEDCPAEAPNCVQDKPGRTVCAVAREPDPRCTRTPTSSWCEGSTLFECASTGYLTVQLCRGDTPDCVVQTSSVDGKTFTIPQCGVAHR